MIPCKHCNTPNSLDSTFCKRCGTGLPEDEILTAKAKLEKVVEEGVHALNLGRVEEAMAVAEMAVASDPSMSPAFALKASAHERRGEIAEALECAERLVELNPDSELDKIKRNQLRTALGASALNYRPPNRMVAGVAALSVAAIVLCSAILTAKYVGRQGPARIVMNPAPRQDLANPMGLAQTPQTESPTMPNSVQNPAPAPAPVTPSTQPNVSKISELGPGDTGPATGSDEGQPLPPARRNDGDPPPSVEISPLNPPVPANLGVTNNAPVTKGQDPSVGPDPGPETANKNPVVQTPPPDPGEIDIRIHDSGAGPHSKNGSAQDNPKDTSKIFMKMGNDYYQMGNYNGAASSLEKAVSSGADPVRANYRLAQSYNSLGKKAEAIDAYKRAIAACTNSLNAGKGDSAKLRATRDASETALRQLQGG